MGRHSKPAPKAFSFLGSAGGIFAGMVLVGGIFAAAQITGNNPFTNDNEPPVERPVIPKETPENMVANGTAMANLPGPTDVPALAPGRAVDPPTVTVPVPPTEVPTNPPTLSPSPNPSPVRPPQVDVEVEAETPIVDLDTDVELRVPLLGQAVDTVGDVVTVVTDPLKDLLGK